MRPAASTDEFAWGLAPNEGSLPGEPLGLSPVSPRTSYRLRISEKFLGRPGYQFAVPLDSLQPFPEPQWNPATPWQLALLSKLCAIPFPGNTNYAAQAAISEFLSMSSASVQPMRVPGVTPTPNGTTAPLPVHGGYRDKDGVAIYIGLLETGGVLSMLQFFAADGSYIRDSQPDISTVGAAPGAVPPSIMNPPPRRKPPPPSAPGHPLQ